MSQETTVLLIKDLRNARRLFGPDWAKRIAAAQALGVQRAGEAVNDLAAVIHENQNPDLVPAALQALGQIGTPQAVDALIAILCGGDVKQRQLVSQLLVGLGPQVAGRALLSTSVSSATTDRNAAENVLKEYGDITPLLISLLDDSDSAIRDSAQQRLTHSGLAIVPALLRASIHPSLTVRQAVDVVLSSIGNTTALLVELLDDKDYQIRNIARDRLLQGGSGSIPALLNAVSGDAHTSQTTAADVLAEIGATAIPATCEAAHRTSGPGQVRLVRALGGFGQPAIDCLIALMKDPDLETSRAAAETLGKIGQPAVGPLVRLLAEGEASEAAKAAATLVALGQPAVPALIDVLSHRSLRARKLAAETLLQIKASEAWVLQPLLSYWIETDVAPRALIVDPSGKGDFMTLTEAVTAVPDYTLIRLASGVHTLPEPLEIEKPLVFFGDGMNTCRVVCGGRWYVIRWIGQGILGAAGIGFERRSDEWGAVLEASSGELRLSGCSFQGGTMWGRPDVHGRSLLQEELTARGLSDRKLMNASKMILGNALHIGSGLWLYGDVRAQVDKCVATGNQGDGIAVEEYANVRLSDNRCVQNGMSGVFLTGASHSLVARNICENNKQWGVGVKEQAQAQLDDNTCNRNGLCGVIVTSSEACTALRNRCASNREHGIEVAEHATPQLRENSCHTNGGAGIGYFGSSGGSAQGNRCVGGGGQQHGIYVSDQAGPTLEENVCESNELGGISFWEESSGTANGNTCQKNFAGIMVTLSAKPTLSRNSCIGNIVGISFADNAQGSAVSNICTENTEGGIMVGGQAKPFLAFNTCAENTKSGIAFIEFASGTAQGNRCLQNNYHGIAVGDAANPTLTGNFCENNRAMGILYTDSAAGSALQNRCIANGHCGILVITPARPTLQDNDCRSNRVKDVGYQ